MFGAFRAQAGLAVLLAVSSATPSFAQQAAKATTARDLISAFFVDHIGPGETAEKFRQRRALVVNALSDGLALAIARTPLGGSSAGFTYLVDPVTGERSLKSESFGPLFLDRPMTTGAGQINLGVHYNHLSFSKFQGTDLRTKGLMIFDNRVLYTRDNFEQYIEEYVSLEPDVSVTTAYGSYGLTDRIDIGVAVPFARLSLKGRRYWDYDISKTYAVAAVDRAFFTPGPKGTQFVQDSGEVSATGLGDVTIRGKLALGARGQDVAIIGAVRVPTGDETNLLGTGKTAGELKFVGARKISGRASIEGNGGYSFGGLSDEFSYGAGLDLALLEQKQLTVTLELLGQNLRDSVNGTSSDKLLSGFDATAIDTRFTPPEPIRYSADRLFFPSGSVNLLNGAAGAKYRLGGSALLSGGVLFPLNSRGLRTSPTLFVGLDLTVTGRR